MDDATVAKLIARFFVDAFAYQPQETEEWFEGEDGFTDIDSLYEAALRLADLPETD